MMHVILRSVRTAAAAVLPLSVFLVPTVARAWGCEGHQTVALIALSQLSQNAHTKAESVLQKSPIKTQMTSKGKPVKLFRRCKSKLDAFVDASTWADDIRGTPFDKWKSGNWHFLDVPRGAARSAVSTSCAPDGCVTNAIAKQVATLQNPHASAKSQADALRFLIHFVGDIHQPLHCATNSDRGGNCVPVQYANRSGQLKDGELHAAWDTNMIDADPAYPGGPNMDTDVQGFATALTNQFQTQIPTWKASPVNVANMQTTAEDWAWESHQLADSTVYGALPNPIPVRPDIGPVPKNCTVNGDNIKNDMAQFHEKLQQPYESSADPVIHEQLTKAGVRLALILNAVWQ
jgi:hypothetical protein